MALGPRAVPTRGTLVELRSPSREWQRGVVMKTDDECGMLLVRLRAGARTAWAFGDEESCRLDTAKPTTAAAPAAPAAPADSSADARMQPVAKAGLGFVETPQPGQCVGTLRWDEAKSFPPLPPPPWSAHEAPPAIGCGWREYIEMRVPPDAGGTIRIEPPMLDGASYPLSLLHAMQTLRLRPPSHEPLTVLIIGASSKAEARLLHASNYWLELAHFLPAATLQLVFVGPEIDASSASPQQLTPRLSAECVRGTLGELLRARPRLDASNAVVVGFNTGMGNGLLALMQSWLPDLCDIARKGLVAVFTCARAQGPQPPLAHATSLRHSPPPIAQ